MISPLGGACSRFAMWTRRLPPSPNWKRNYDEHAAHALLLAKEYFDAKHVLAKLIGRSVRPLNCDRIEPAANGDPCSFSPRATSNIRPPTRGRIVVWGMMARSPFGGMIWQVLHYLVPLRQLGFDVWYVEDSDELVYDPVTFDLTAELRAERATIRKK